MHNDIDEEEQLQRSNTCASHLSEVRVGRADLAVLQVELPDAQVVLPSGDEEAVAVVEEAHDQRRVVRGGSAADRLTRRLRASKQALTVSNPTGTTGR